jgi:hypothetical protein
MKARRRIGAPEAQGLLGPCWNDAITIGNYERRNGVRLSFCAATILRTECPLWVKSGHSSSLGQCPLFARSAAKEAAGKVATSRRTVLGVAHPILEQKRIADELREAKAKRPGDAPFGSRIEEYLAARTANGNRLRESGPIETRR